MHHLVKTSHTLECNTSPYKNQYFQEPPSFHRVTEQHNSEIRNAFRGNRPLPYVHTIPSQYYREPHTLFQYLYQKVLFEHVLKATNDRIRSKVLYPEDKIVSMQELIQYFCIDHLAHPSFMKPAHMKFYNWWPQIKERARLLSKKELDLTLSRNRFCFIARYLECGINVDLVDKKVKVGSRLVTKLRDGQPIKIHNLNTKLDPLINNLNSTWQKYKNPGQDRSFCLDESFRKTYSNKDQMKTYLPSKPSPYGQKFQALVDEDFYCHKIAFDHSKQFALWEGTLGLVKYMIPDSYKYIGCTVTADNYYNTWNSLTQLHEQGVAIVGTMRKSSAGKVMGHAQVKNLTRVVPKRSFVRKMEIFETELNETVHGQGQFVQIAFYSDKRDKTVCLCTNDCRLFNTPDQSHKSKILGQREIPEMVKYYNKSKIANWNIILMNSIMNSANSHAQGLI